MTYRSEIDSEYQGILPYHEIFYLSGIRNAGAKAIEHFDRFIGLEILEQTPDAACYEFFSAVMQAANMSIFFWPNPRKSDHQARGNRLRENFENSDIERIKDRKLRNIIVHLDEYLDSFCAKNSTGNIIDGFIGDIEHLRQDHQRVLRMIDPLKQRAILYGYEFDYSGYFEAVNRIASTANHMWENGGRISRSQ